jgi:hypothetical protein
MTHMTHAERRLAYCSVCRGVLPFDDVRIRMGPIRLRRFECERCRTVHRLDDPGAAVKRRTLRYLIYAGTAGMTAAAVGTALAALGNGHPLITTRLLGTAWGMTAMSLGCAARAGWLALGAEDFGRLTPVEREDLHRRLCPGMIRSDVVDVLARRGWSIGKIRTALGSLKPTSRRAA